ncbi:MAG: glycine betaine ABC transporter substrate-binding protein [Spirochaetia bacterium]
MRKTIITILTLVLFSTLCFAGGSSEATLRVGSKNFTEQYVMSEMISLMLEDAGFNVNKNFGMSSFAVRSALETNQIDLYADYTGTGWTAYLEHDDQINDPVELFERVQAEDAAENDIVWLERFNVNNTYALAVSQEFAEEHDLQTLSDLADLINSNPQEYTIALDYEFYERPDGFFAMADTYNMEADEGQVRTMEIGLSYEAIESGDIDVAMVFSTDGKLRRYNLFVLEDNRNFFPVYNLAVTVHADVLEEYPEIEEILSPLANTLTEEQMTNMNYQVDAENREPIDVAREYLVEQGLISE